MNPSRTGSDHRSVLGGEGLFWIAHAMFWLAAFLAGVIVVKAFGPGVATPAWFVGSRVTAGFTITAAIRWLSKHDAVRQQLGISKAGLMLGGPLAGAVAVTLLMALAQVGAADPAMRLGLTARFVLNLTVLSAWSAAYFGYHLLREGQSSELRTLEAESLAYKNELRHLQSQISPHFLFNALNTILACKHDPEAIETVTQSLAKYLRFLLRPTDTLEPLGGEIDALEEYLTIQSFRFGDRLTCRIDCDADIRRIPVLPMMIQPLVENALKYGTASETGTLEVTVRAWREGPRLLIEVANTGDWGAATSAPSTGTGLRGLRRRLTLYAGPEATLATSEHDGWVRVLLTLPLKPEYAVQEKLERAR